MEQTIQQLRLAFVGVSHWHVPLYLRAVKSHRLNVVAVSDPDAALAARFGELLGCPSYTDGLALLDREKPDFVFAFAPHCEMADLALELIRRQIPFSMEKPMGLCAAQTEEISRAAEKGQVFCAVPFVWRYSDLVRDFRERVDPASVIHLAFKFIAGPPSRYLETSPWMLRRDQAGGGSMTNLGVHFIDMAMYLTGCADAQVLASAFHYQPEYDVDCYATALLKLGSSATLVLETGYAFPMDEVHRDNRWNIVTREGYYTLDSGAFEERRYGEETVSTTMDTDSDGYYPIFVVETLRQYLAGEQPRAGLGDMVAVRRVLDEINRKGEQ